MRNRFGRTAAFVALAVIGAPEVALAVSSQVRASCREDYYTHCPSHALGSDNLRRCMKTAGPKLSSACIKALVASGEISNAEVQAIARKLRQAN